MINIYIIRLFACYCHSLTLSMEDINICNSVCLRYVDDKKPSVFQSNAKGKIIKTKKKSKRYSKT